MSTPEQMDRDEKKRVKAMLARAKENRGHISGLEGYIPSTKKSKKYVRVRMDYQLVRGGSMVMGDLVRKKLLAMETADSLKDKGVILVKDGKLTPEGIARGIKLPNA